MPLLLLLLSLLLWEQMYITPWCNQKLLPSTNALIQYSPRNSCSRPKTLSVMYVQNFLVHRKLHMFNFSLHFTYEWILSMISYLTLWSTRCIHTHTHTQREREREREREM